MLVGGNGAGISTFYRKCLEPLSMSFINADLLAKQVFPDDPEGNSYEAAQLATQMREQLLIDGANFCFETVFSHPSKIDFVAKAKAFGYQVVLVFIRVDSPLLNKVRISQRVGEGGHFVPDDKVEARIPGTLANARSVLPLCDHVRILDNSRCDNPFEQVATIRNQTITEHKKPSPVWASDLLYS
jgi:predicted ABC-type ATPase